jgi:hypothetical protein
MGAIHGFDHRGFIGEVYKRFPFPKYQEDFKQNPEGFKTRSLIELIINRYVSKTNILFTIDRKSEQIAIGEYLFDKFSFHELIRYIWLGGFPRWKEEIRPEYVMKMKKKINESRNSILDGRILK